MTRHTAWFLFCSLLFIRFSTARAQTKACEVTLPVGLIDLQGNLLEGLTAKDITVHLKKQKLAVESLTYDTGPRRVLFVVDTGRHLPGGARRMEYALLNHLLNNARPGDTFALLTARGASREVRFDQGKDAISKAVMELSTDIKEDKKAGPMLDTIAEGISWFGVPQQGDAVLLMTDQLVPSDATSKLQNGYAVDVRPLNESSKTSFKRLVDLLAAHRVRVFGLQFGAISLDPATYEPTDENLIGLSLGSGGYVVVDGIDQFGRYQLTDARIAGMQKRTYQLFGAIAQYYSVKVKAPDQIGRQQWNLALAPDLRKNTRALYPRWFESCAGQ